MEKNKNISYSKILKYYLPFLKDYSAAFFFMVVFFALGTILKNIVSPIFFKNIIDALSNYSNATFDAVWLNSALMISIILFSTCCYRIGDILEYRSVPKFVKKLHNFVFSEIHKKSYTFFINSFAGGLVAKHKRFVNAFERIYAIIIFEIAFPIMIILGTFVTLFFVQKIFLIPMVIFTIVYLLVLIPLLSKKKYLDLELAAADSKITAGAADSITNFLTIKMFSNLSYEKTRFFDVSDEEERARTNEFKFDAYIKLVLVIITNVADIAIFLLSIYLWFKGLILVGSIVLVKLYTSTITDRLWSLSRSITKLTAALNDANEMIEIIEKPIEVLDGLQTEHSQMKQGAIEFRNVSFGYGNNGAVLANFDLRILPGEKVGLVGKSGAGKTTVTKLLLRLMNIDDGLIAIDGQDIEKVKQDELRSMISYVPQDPVLFHRSLKENIAYGKEGATDEEIMRAAKLAHAHEFIENFEHGYETLVGERGVKLSGGERQRIAIARAILKNSPILVLDEATSSLDSISEKLIQESLDFLMKNRTAIVIAHRLSTVQKLDRIIVLDKGVIVEQGSHEELLKKKGSYFDLWQHQSGGFIS